MLWIVGFWATINKTPTIENTEFHYFFADSSVFYISTLNMSQTVTLKLIKCTIFWKNSKRSLVHFLNVLPKLWLVFCCCQQKIQKICHFFIYAFQDLQNSVACLLTWISFFYIKFGNFSYITCSVPNLVPIWSWVYGLTWITEYSKSNNI